MAAIAIAIVVLSEMALLLALLWYEIPLRKPNATAKAIGLLVSLGYVYMIFENGVPSLKATTLFVCSIILACVIERPTPHMNEMETWRKKVSQLESQPPSELKLLKTKYARHKKMLEKLESVLPGYLTYKARKIHSTGVTATTS